MLRRNYPDVVVPESILDIQSVIAINDDSQSVVSDSTITGRESTMHDEIVAAEAYRRAPASPQAQRGAKAEQTTANVKDVPNENSRHSNADNRRPDGMPPNSSHPHPQRRVTNNIDNIPINTSSSSSEHPEIKPMMSDISEILHLEDMRLSNEHTQFPRGTEPGDKLENKQSLKEFTSGDKYNETGASSSTSQTAASLERSKNVTSQTQSHNLGLADLVVTYRAAVAQVPPTREDERARLRAEEEEVLTSNDSHRQVNWAFEVFEHVRYRKMNLLDVPVRDELKLWNSALCQTERLAMQRIPKAMWLLGAYCFIHIESEEGKNRAVAQWQQALSSGDSRGAYALGLFYANQKQTHEKALHYYNISAEKNESMGLYVRLSTLFWEPFL
jgi:hypothetical protein